MFGEFGFGDVSVGGVIANAARSVPGAVAAVIDRKPLTFDELDRAGSSVARQLVAEGHQPGETALVFGGTSFAMLAHFVGCARAGLIFAPVNAGLDEATISQIGRNLSPAVVLADEDHRGLTSLIEAPAFWGDPTLVESTPNEPVLPAVGASDPHIAFFTSGSTGAPKAALLSHRTSVLRSHPGSQLEPRGAALCPYPLFHMAGWTISMQQWHARAAVVFVEGTNAETLTAALIDHRIERFNAIPALWTRLADYLGDKAEGALPQLRFADTGTSPTSVELLSTISRMAPNAHVRVFYGSTEAGNVASLHHEDLLTRPNSCGQPSVLTEVNIAEDGELLVRGPLLFEGYLSDAEATAAALVDGWYRSGDRAEVDADGYLSIVGRLGTVIRSGGESIDPETVEKAVLSHPAVDGVAVFGVPDEQWGELVWAAVVVNQSFELEDLRRHLSPDGPQALARHQHPRALLHVDAIPRTTATGQVDRHRLRQLAQNVAS